MQRNGDRLKLEFLLPLCVFAIALLFMVVSLKNYVFIKKSIPGDAFFPVVMSVFVMIFSGISFVKALGKPIKQDIHLEEFYPLLAVVAICAARLVIGFFPAILVVLILWFKRIERFSWKRTLAISVPFTAVMYLIFVIWIDIQFRSGLIGRLLGF